jgi:hypothetical protein
MRRILRRRPSPALVVATLALFLAAGGTGYALTLPANSVGSAQIQAGRVLNSKLHPGAVSNSKMGRGAVTFSKMASNQMTEAKIRDGSLLGKDLAANTVTGAQVDESTLDVTRFALLDGAGNIATQSGGITVAQQIGSRTILNMGASVAGRPILATLSGTSGGEVATAPCGGASSTNPGGVTCPQPFDSPNFVSVTTFTSAGAADAQPVYVTVPLA